MYPSVGYKKVLLIEADFLQSQLSQSTRQPDVYMITLLEAQRTLIYTADSKGKNKDIEIENKHHRHHTRDSLGPLPKLSNDKYDMTRIRSHGWLVWQ